jgi:Flp pilus assembly protein TadG
VAALRRAGYIQSVELLLIVPIVLILVFGMVEYGMILAIDQQLALASREGARVAAQGGSAAEVQAAALVVLGAGSVANNAVVTSQLSDVSGSQVSVDVAIPDASTAVPDLLAIIGLSLKNMTLDANAVMRRE